MKALRNFLLIVAVALIFGGCYYNFLVPEEVIDPTDPEAPEVSFANEIQPIFTAKCVSCHKPGIQVPDLTEGNAYESIRTSRYISTSSPETSLIYTRPHPDNSDSHPKYSEGEAAKVLTWISQGAANN